MSVLTAGRRVAPLLLLMLALAGCSMLESTSRQPPPTTLERVDVAAAALIDNIHGHSDDLTPIVATTFVDVDRLEQSSTLGRTVSEMFVSRLVTSDLHVIEVKLRDSLYIEENTGELILSRNVQRLGQDYDASSVLVGTYAQAQDRLFVNARLVRIDDRSILGATSFELPLTTDLRVLLPGSYP
ncbi:FlgO family outer membrane protein [Salinicola aestuarinus]|uniref:FlgO family outer membrane protein n=1 Tax=Salinicola aestuarinus TaxID=1949082 RepID=UPI000DA12687|nr:FlgO family outer membrane protein [Salinicola aestuarinus]